MGKGTYYTSEQEEWLRDNFYRVGSYAELTEKFNSRFCMDKKVSMISWKCNKHMGLKGMFNSTQYGNAQKWELPVGTIRRTTAGTYIKVAPVMNNHINHYKEPYWLPLQKKIYQDAYGVIAPGKMVCFLDKNPQNFALDNLYPIDRKTSAIMSKNRWWSENPELTLAAIKWCALHYAIKEVGQRDRTP